jgi:hypothetical protein
VNNNTGTPYVPPTNNNNNNNNPPTYSKTGLNTLFAGLKSTPQTFTVTAGTYSTKFGAEGTVLKFYPNSFKNGSGQVISNGTVTIKLIEMYTPGPMIANRATTTANGKFLRSGGQVKITATMNGQTVYANKYGISFAQAGPSTQDMSLYVGNTNNEDSVVTWSIMDSMNTGTNTGGTVSDSGQNIYTYTFDSCTSFNFINCDYFYNYTGTLTDMFCVMPDTTFNSSNTEVFVVFPGINSVTTMGQYETNTATFHLYSSFWIPVGINVHVVVIANKNGTYYYFQQLNNTVTSNMSVTATMTQQTLSYIQTQLGNL